VSRHFDTAGFLTYTGAATNGKNIGNLVAALGCIELLKVGAACSRGVGSIFNLRASYDRVIRKKKEIRSDESGWIKEWGIIWADATGCWCGIITSTINASSLLNSSTSIVGLNEEMLDLTTRFALEDLRAIAGYSCFVFTQVADIVKRLIWAPTFRNSQVLGFQTLLL
jgi:hypothetical protein